MMEGDFTDAAPSGVVPAGALDHSGFDVLQGIPGTKSLYAHVMTPKYLVGYKYIKKIGTKTYTARGTIIWNLPWIVGEGEDAQEMTNGYQEKRKERFRRENITKGKSKALWIVIL